jgi:hypothetical protein
MVRFLIPLLVVSLALTLPIAPASAATEVDEDQLGGWYMYFWGKRFEDSHWGLQGDVQYRNWDVIGDLEQLLIRGGVTYTPSSGDALFTLGYANITSGEFGSSNSTSKEDRIYQEALLPQKIGERVYLRHRFRLEQRWVEDQDFRNRVRYALFMDIPLNRSEIKKGTWYLAFYNEFFLNLERDIGDDREVEIFDRNRLYGAVGYTISDKLKVQGGYMYQFSDTVDKGQLQISLHQTF